MTVRGDPLVSVEPGAYPDTIDVTIHIVDMDRDDLVQLAEDMDNIGWGFHAELLREAID